MEEAKQIEKRTERRNKGRGLITEGVACQRLKDKKLKLDINTGRDLYTFSL